GRGVAAIDATAAAAPSHGAGAGGPFPCVKPSRAPAPPPSPAARPGGGPRGDSVGRAGPVRLAHGPRGGGPPPGRWAAPGGRAPRAAGLGRNRRREPVDQGDRLAPIDALSLDGGRRRHSTSS